MVNGNPECSECYNKKKLGTQCKCTLTLINIVHLHLDTAYCALETVHLHLDTAYHALQCLILMANGNPGNSECYNNKSVRDTVHVCLGTCKHSAFCLPCTPVPYPLYTQLSSELTVCLSFDMVNIQELQTNLRQLLTLSLPRVMQFPTVMQFPFRSTVMRKD